MRKFLFTIGAAAALASAFPAVSRADVCSSVAGNLVLNCGFETGDFTDWSLSGNVVLGFTTVETTGYAGYDPNSGNYFAALGPFGSDEFLSQTLATTPGDTYTISWYVASNGFTPNDFDVEWDGTTLFSQTDIPATGSSAPFPYVLHTDTVTAVGSDTLTFSFRNDPSYLALDDISVVTSTPSVPEPGYLGLLSGVLVVLPFIRKRKTA